MKPTRLFAKFFLLLPLLTAVSCSGIDPICPEEPEQTDPVAAGVARWVTKADQSRLFAHDSLAFGAPEGMTSNLVRIYKADRHQEIDGFGAALTGATCFNLLRMDTTARTRFLKEIFDPVTGLGSSLIRVSIGASDFSVDSEFTWCDTPGLENFAIAQEDKKYLIPILKEVYAINPAVKIIASPWSAPRWMKTEDSWTSSSLDESHYLDYANYFVKWIKTMEDNGFNIHAMTIQNEPLNRGNSMSMYMSWTQQCNFIKTALGTTFADAGIKTKVLVFDHNYDYDGKESQLNYPLKIFADPEASKFVAGSAWHNYSGSPAELQKIVANAPDKEIYFTEASIGDWNHGKVNGFANCLMGDFEGIFMGTMYNDCKGVTLWNLLLDTKNGPHRGEGACSTCYGVATIDAATGNIVKRNSQYFDIAHASKVIRPGAVRIGIGGYLPADSGYQAFENPDGSIAIIILNKSVKQAEFVFQANRTVYVKVPSKSIVSLRWDDKN